MDDQQHGTRLQQLAQMSQAISGLSIVVGIFVFLTGTYFSHQTLKMSELASVNDFFKADSEIREQMSKFLQVYDKDKVHQVISNYKSVELAYHSEELHDVRMIGRHYERLGALVKLKYIDFDLVYEVIPFPDSFWTATEEFRTAAENGNWANGQGLPDFWKNFSYLHDQYVERRQMERKQSSPPSH
jgi:hypothetical protein